MGSSSRSNGLGNTSKPVESRLERLRNVLKMNPGKCSPYLYVTVPGQSETRLALKDMTDEALERQVDARFRWGQGLV